MTLKHGAKLVITIVTVWLGVHFGVDLGAKIDSMTSAATTTPATS